MYVLAYSIFYFMTKLEITELIDPNTFVFRLYSTDGANVLVIDRYNRLLRGLRVYSKNIRRSKNRLVKVTIDEFSD